MKLVPCNIIRLPLEGTSLSKVSPLHLHFKHRFATRGCCTVLLELSTVACQKSLGWRSLVLNNKARFFLSLLCFEVWYITFYLPSAWAKSKKKEKRSERQISYREKALLRDIYIYVRRGSESRNKTRRTFLFKFLTRASVWEWISSPCFTTPQ